MTLFQALSRIAVIYPLLSIPYHQFLIIIYKSRSDDEPLHMLYGRLAAHFCRGPFMRLVWCSFLIVLSCFNVFATDGGESGDVAERPALIILVAVDQLRRDRLQEPFNAGLKRLLDKGRVFKEATLDHAITTTCPGHSVMLTGTNPGKAGIPGNYYIDAESFEERYCVEDQDPANQVFGRNKNHSPNNLLVTTLGDWLKEEDSKSRVFSVGGKDRSAIMMGGHKADGVFWFDWTLSKFTSSRYYLNELPDYVNSFNGSDPFVDGFLRNLPETWTHAPGRARADDFPGEDEEWNNTSGHPLRAGDKPGGQVYDSPYLDTASIDLAIEIVRQEKLGQRDSTDLLAISLSATDTVGHLYGPYSAESESTLANVDKKLGEFLDFLDARIGEDNYIVILTADHGVAELPEWASANDRLQCPEPSGRISVYGFALRLYWHAYSRFSKPFGNPLNLVKYADSQLKINKRYAAELGFDPTQVIDGMKEVLEDEVAIERAWTRQELESDPSEIARLYRNSLVDDKSGDLFIQLHRTCLIRDEGTTHGMPHDYDRNIPLIFFGKGITPVTVGGKAHSVDIATTLAKFLELATPSNLDGQVLKLN
jgi:predicted AlkP superfamily pyrophosphatase or phosphodiesterase